MDDDIVARLRLYSRRMKETRSTVLGLLLSDSADEIQRLRRMHCEGLAATIVGRTPQQMAENLGWDCFKEGE